MPSPATAPRRALAAFAAAALVAACGGADTASGVAPDANDAEWVRAVMAERYLYADRMPAADLTRTTDAAPALEALRVNPPDRFSYVEQRARYDAFFDEGRSVGLGIGLRIADGTVVLRFVQPDSPAGRAGLRRGDRIVGIDGADVAPRVAAGTVLEALGPQEAGVTVRLATERDGARIETTLVKADYAVAPVLAMRVIDHAGTRVGYVALYTFTEPTRAAWADAIAQVRAAGARQLVVDLRENGGGRLFVAADVAGSLAPAAAVGQLFTELRHAPRRRADDLAIPIAAHPAAGAFDRVAWLVSETTCSASESLIAGLRPYRDDPVIGAPTCGKPVGFSPQTRGDTVLSAVTFSGRNRDGLTDWFDGLPPTCAVAAEPYLPFGDERDPRLAEALRRLATGACSPTSDAPTTKAGSAARAPVANGMASQTGLF